jgi:hypothetical protein
MRNHVQAAIAAVLLLTCLCAAAQAEQGPPLKVRLLGEPRGVAAGETFKGTIEIVSGADETLSDFRLEGAGWRVKRIDAAPRITMTRDQRLEIPFEVEAAAEPAELRFEFSFGGRTVTKLLDLGKSHHERMTTAAPAAETWDAPAPLGAADLQKARPLDDGSIIGVGPNPDPEDGDVADKRTIVVSGRFVYHRSDGVTVGADGVSVRVYDEDTFSDDFLGSDATDAYGWFSISISTGDAGENNPDLYVKFESANTEVEVEDATWEINYTWKTGTWDNYSGSTLNTGTRSPSSEGEHPALHILTDITRTWRWLLSHEGYNTASTDVQWPDGDSGAYYNGFWEEIHVGRDRQWREDTHTHEYMHHWVNRYASAVTPDYCNGICDTVRDWWFDDCGHCMWCVETDHDAFAEGFPNWVADVVTRSYAGDYGIASQFTRDQENLNTCSEDGTWDDPYRTEGFFGALLRDIEDAGNDNHGHYPGYADVLTAGTNEIFDVIDFDQPTTPAGFLADFAARFPSLREGLWETGMNCGYNFDAAAPGYVSNLTSSSHVVGTPSPDPTITYTWTRATDDASGIDGYGISITTSPGLPSAVKDIEDVTSYTTPILAPGNYYFNIRARDRDGNWSGSYRWFGPVTVRDPEPSDLTSYQPTGWQHPLVPRNDTTATGSSASVSPYLDGNAASTYWNVRGINQGESSTSTGFVSRLYVDNVYRYWAGWGAVGAGGSFYGVNLGPFSVRGGRHSMAVRYDALDAVAETNEANNVYGSQWVWTPYPLTANTPVVRSAPPAGTDGWDDVTEGTLWYNCDGLRTGSTGWWNAVYVRSTDNSQNLDLRLHPVSTGATNGFTTNLGYSTRPAGYLDAVLTNRNVVAETQWDVGVLNNSGATSSYEAVHVTSFGLTFGDSLTLSMGANDYLDLVEFYVGSGNTGFVSVTVDVDPADGPLTLLWLDETFTTGTLSSYSAGSVTSSTDGRARLDFEVADTGYNGLVIYRDPRNGGDALQYTLEIQNTPPDFLPYEAAGWHAPIVPRPADDGTGSLVALPDTLYGNVASTYLNFAVRNESPTGSPTGVLVRAFIDGVYRAWITWGSFPAYTNGLFNWDYAWNFSGGRHTLDMRCDPLQAIEEIHETNNIYGEQYVWAPLALAPGATAARSSPPERTGGWDYVASGEPLWYNCDGLRIPARTNWWHAVAVMPGYDSDVDVRIHDLLTGVKSGFAANKATSSWGVESSDFVLVNYNLTTAVGQDVGVLKWSGSTGYTAEHAVSQFIGGNPAGVLDGQTIPSGRILDLHEVYLDPALLPGGVFTVTLSPMGGDVDWGLSLHPADDPFQSKSTMVPGAGAWGNPAGLGEVFSAVVPAAGYYCLAVWKAKTDDLPRDGAYRLTFGADLTDVRDDVPSATGLARVYPNPFNPMTTIAFDLAEPAAAEVAIYDLQGALVRTLVHESRPAGRHEVVWDGTDDAGRRTASGVYMVRLKAGSTAQMRKLVLVK